MAEFTTNSVRDGEPVMSAAPTELGTPGIWGLPMPSIAILPRSLLVSEQCVSSEISGSQLLPISLTSDGQLAQLLEILTVPSQVSPPKMRVALCLFKNALSRGRAGTRASLSIR
jgi:hypothetical protein